MATVKEKLANMFAKVMVGTVTREEGTLLLNHMAKEDLAGTATELSFLIENPPPNVFPKTILHTIALTRNKGFFNIIVAALEHKSEEVSVFAAEELARFRTDDAKRTLTEHLNSEVYHIRRASALALARELGKEGREILRRHVLEHPDHFFRLTSSLGLLSAGMDGEAVLMEILKDGTPGAVATAAEALASAAERLSEDDLPKVVEALTKAGDIKEVQCIAALLQLVGSFKDRAKRFEGYVRAFDEYHSDIVRKEARTALSRISGR